MPARTPKGSRYTKTPVFQLRDGAGGLTNTNILGIWVRPIDFTDYPFDTYHIVSRDEVGRLDLIAHRYYSDSALWWAIADANGINNFLDDMKTGDELGIPALQDILNGISGVGGNNPYNYPTTK
jgi:hypothetical protein